jgi:hypothetical protein
MNYFQPYSLPADQTILTAWDSQLAELADCPALLNALANQRELFPRFASYYAQLRALPRGTRRALRRKLARARELISIQPKWQRKLAGSLAGAALLLALAQSVNAATINVTTNVPDINDGDGKCSLIEAIINANDDAATHPDCAAGDGADTIVLPKDSTITLMKRQSTYYYDYTGLPLFKTEIVIEGNGAQLTRKKSSPGFRILATTPTANVVISNLTITGGSAYWGGAIYNSGMLTIANSTISGNDAIYEGGGLYNRGELHINRSVITHNKTLYYYPFIAFGGGGIFNGYGTATYGTQHYDIWQHSGTVIQYQWIRISWKGRWSCQLPRRDY